MEVRPTKAEEASTEHHNIAPSAVPPDVEAARAKTDFESKCVACHAITGGEGRKLGPDLAGVTKRRSEDWIARFLRSPERMLATDPDAKALLGKYKVPMPNQNLSEDEIRGYLKYFKFLDSGPQAMKH